MIHFMDVSELSHVCYQSELSNVNVVTKNVKLKNNEIRTFGCMAHKKTITSKDQFNAKRQTNIFHHTPRINYIT